MNFTFIKKLRQHGLNVAEKFGIISVVLTGGIILVNYVFGLHLSQYLRQIPLIGQLINIELIEEFEDIQDGDLFYEELKAQLALLNIAEEDISSIQVRKDSAGQETFKIITKDGDEQQIVVKKTGEDEESDSGFQLLKQVEESYYRDDDGAGLVKDKERDVFVEVKEREIYIEVPYTGDIPECKPELVQTEIAARGDCEVCEICETSVDIPCNDRYDEGYTAGANSCDTTVDPNYDATAAAALCQKSIDIEYQKGYDAGYSVGYDNGNSAGYQRGYNVGISEGGEDRYQEGYSAGYAAGHTAGYDEGYSVGYTAGADSCYITTGP